VQAASFLSTAMYSGGFRNLMLLFRVLKAGYAANMDLSAREQQHIFSK
jgi:hypothetical protein